jgi:branched-chain amino acid transport system ATP-binding protein
MLAMSRALTTEPRLLLLDELSAGLAPLVVSELYDVVARLALDGISILVVEQSVRAALSIADRVAVLANGRIVAEGPPKDVEASIQELYLGSGGPSARRAG